MTRFFIFILLFTFSLNVFATHNKAGEITYKYISGNTYEITINTYTKASSPADKPFLELHYGDNTADTVARVSKIVLNDVNINSYKINHTYPGAGQYIIYIEDPNRNANIINIPGNSDEVPFYLETTLRIDPFTGINNSVSFLSVPIMKAVVGVKFTYNMTAVDTDADYLTYELVSCKGAGGLYIPGYAIPTGVSINYISGELLWDSPKQIGEFVFAVKVNEYRNYRLVGSVIRDFQIDVFGSGSASVAAFSGVSSWIKDSYNNYVFNINPGDSVNFSFGFQNSSALTIHLDNYSEVFAKPGASFNVNGSSNLSADFIWETISSDERCEPYIVTFRGVSDYQSSTEFQKDLTVVINVKGSSLNCTVPIASIQSPSEITSSIISPNPFKESAIFQLGNNKKLNGILSFYNLLGEKVLEQCLTETNNEVKRENLKAGIYLYKLSNKTQIISSGKIVIE